MEEGEGGRADAREPAGFGGVSGLSKARPNPIGILPQINHRPYGDDFIFDGIKNSEGKLFTEQSVVVAVENRVSVRSDFYSFDVIP